MNKISNLENYLNSKNFTEIEKENIMSVIHENGISPESINVLTTKDAGDFYSQVSETCLSFPEKTGKTLVGTCEFPERGIDDLSENNFNIGVRQAFLKKDGLFNPEYSLIIYEPEKEVDMKLSDYLKEELKDLTIQKIEAKISGNMSKEEIAEIVNNLGNKIYNDFDIKTTEDPKTFGLDATMLNHKSEHSWDGSTKIKETGEVIFGKCQFGEDNFYEYSNNGNIAFEEYNKEIPNFKLNENIAILKEREEISETYEGNYKELIIYVGNDLDMEYKDYWEAERKNDLVERIISQSDNHINKEEANEIVNNLKDKTYENFMDENFMVKISNDFQNFGKEITLNNHKTEHSWDGSTKIKETGEVIFGKCQFGEDNFYKYLNNGNTAFEEYNKEIPNFKLNENIAILKEREEISETSGDNHKYSSKELIIYVGNDLDMEYKDHPSILIEKESLDNHDDKNNDLELD